MSDQPVRISQVTTAVNTLPASPTGAPWLPPKFVPWLAVVCALASVGSVYAPEGPLQTASHAVLGICSLLGIASPGWRK
jgi:hypothetical protein